MNPFNAITTGARKVREYNERRTYEIAAHEAQQQADRAYAARAKKFKPAGKDLYKHPKTGKLVTGMEVAADAVRTREWVKQKVMEEKLGPQIERSIERTIRNGEKQR